MNTSPQTDVLVPLITSRCEEAAIEQAVEDFPHAEITVLAVITPLDEPLTGGVVEVSEEDYRQERHVQQHRQHGIDELFQHRVRTR